MNAKGIVFRQANAAAVEEVVLPQLQAGGLLVRTTYSGVSIGTEQSIFSGVRTQNGSFPLIGGYQASGKVEQVGSDVTDFAVGDRVVVPGTHLDGPVSGIWGGHLSMHVTSADGVVKVPDSVPMHEAALYVMPNVGLHGVSMADVNERDTVLIQGQGMIGHMFGQFSRTRGARIITIEPSAFRAELSRRHVTPHVLDPNSDDIGGCVEALTGGAGPTVVAEASADKTLIKNATRHLKPRSRMVFVSWYNGDIALDYHHDFHANEIAAYFPMGTGGNRTTVATLDCMAKGAIQVGDLVTDIVPYEAAPAGYQRLVDGDRTVMGMVIDWRHA